MSYHRSGPPSGSGTGRHGSSSGRYTSGRAPSTGSSGAPSSSSDKKIRRKKFYCDYCDIFLTNDVKRARDEHLKGGQHRRALQQYYEKIFAQESMSNTNQMTRLRHGNYGNNDSLNNRMDFLTNVDMNNNNNHSNHIDMRNSMQQHHMTGIEYNINANSNLPIQTQHIQRRIPPPPPSLPPPGAQASFHLHPPTTTTTTTTNK